MKHEGKRIAVEQRWQHRRNGRQTIHRPFGSIAFPRAYDEFAPVEAYRLAQGATTNRGPLPAVIIERMLESGHWVTLNHRPRDVAGAIRFCGTDTHLRVAVRNGAGEYEPLAPTRTATVALRAAGTVPGNKRPKGKAGFW